VATLAFSSDLVFEKLHPLPTFWALGLKDIPWLPVSPILTRAFHMTPSLLPFPPPRWGRSVRLATEVRVGVI